MKKRYRAYRSSSTISTSLHSEESEAQFRAKGLFEHDSEFLWEIEVDTPEEAQAIYNLRMGFGPYLPSGHWLPCPKCGSPFYPYDSGECWRCGPIDLDWHPCPKCGMLYPEGGRECLRCGPFVPDEAAGNTA